MGLIDDAGGMRPALDPADMLGLLRFADLRIYWADAMCAPSTIRRGTVGLAILQTHLAGLAGLAPAARDDYMAAASRVIDDRLRLLGVGVDAVEEHLAQATKAYAEYLLQKLPDLDALAGQGTRLFDALRGTISYGEMGTTVLPPFDVRPVHDLAGALHLRRMCCRRLRLIILAAAARGFPIPAITPADLIDWFRL